MINGYTSIKVVINKLYRDLGLTEEINEFHVVEWIAEVLDKIGSYYQYKETKTCLELQDGKTILPFNFYRLKDIAFNGKPLSWASNTMYNDYACDNCTIQSCCSEFTFYISDNHIITNIASTDLNSSGTNSICIIYLAVPTDEDGYPLVPDDVYFREACAKYVTYMIDYREYRKGNIPRDIMEKSESDYLFYVNSARGSANMPGERQLARMLNRWVRLIPDQSGHNDFFNKDSERRYNR